MGKLTAAKTLELLGGGAAGAYAAKRYTDLVGGPQQYQDEMGQVRSTPGMSDKQKKDFQMRAAGVGALAIAGPAGLRRMALKRKNRKLMKADLEGIDSAKRKIKEHKPIFWCMSKSKKNVLRGLHLQTKNSQEKFVSVIKGKILDVIVDLRKKSKTFGKHFKIILSEKNSKSLLIPSGFAHGFLGLENENIVLYSNNNYRSKANEIGINWNDQTLKINWPNKKFIISKKDRNNISMSQFLSK